MSLHHPLDGVDLDEFTAVLDLNVVSVVAMTQAVLPAMRAQHRHPARAGADGPRAMSHEG